MRDPWKISQNWRKKAAKYANNVIRLEVNDSNFTVIGAGLSAKITSPVGVYFLCYHIIFIFHLISNVQGLWRLFGGLICVWRIATISGSSLITRPVPEKLGPIGLKCGSTGLSGAGPHFRLCPCVTGQTGQSPGELDLCRYSAYQHRPSHRLQMSSAIRFTGFHCRTMK